MGYRHYQEKVWAGTEASLKAALAAEEGITQRMAAGNYSQPEATDDAPRLLEVADGVATIAIKGSLNNDEGFWNELFGMTGYPEIRDALIAAANDPDVKHILLDIDSGGGAVSGVSDTANLIRMVNDHVKPVATFTDGTMASAAYWLGSAAGEVHAGRTAVVGSIGVLSTHREYSQALKEAGVGVTVVRAGKYKALANSVEPLSEAGKQQIQQVVDAAYQVFVEHVAAMRGKSYAYTDQTMAQGQEFVGQAAADVGLVDTITTFDDLVGQLKTKVIDASNKFMDNHVKPKNPLTGAGGIDLSEESDMKKKALTEQDIAALAAGAALVADGQETAETTAEALAESTPAETATAGEPGEPTEPAPHAESAGEKPDTSATAVQLLTTQLKDKDEALLQARVQISKLEEALTQAQATHSPLLEIAAASINNMRVALNMAKLDAHALDAVQVVAEHSHLAAQFAAQFKVGGIAAVSADHASHNAPQVSPRHKALVNAVRHTK